MTFKRRQKHAIAMGYLGSQAAVSSVLQVVHHIGAQCEARLHGMRREAQLQGIRCCSGSNGADPCSLTTRQPCSQDCTPPLHHCAAFLAAGPAAYPSLKDSSLEHVAARMNTPLCRL